MATVIEHTTRPELVREHESRSVARLAGLWPWAGLSVVLLVSAVLEFAGLDTEGYANTYYAAGVKSMLTSWHNFFFVSYDAGGFVTIDKPPLGLWIEAISAKVFGFSGVSLLLPEALAGVLSVALLFHLVARRWGALAGLLAAAALAITPIAVVIDRNNTIDSLLILTLLLAAWAVLVGAERGQLRFLLLCAVLVGLGFNIKMLQAYLVVPAFWAVYLLGAPLRWRTRLGHLVLATVVLLVVSLSWAVAVDLTPANLRPFVSDSGTNSELSLIVGYNGLGRVAKDLFGGVSSLHLLGITIDLNIVPAVAPEIGDPTALRLLEPALGSQVSWLLSLAVVGLLVAAALQVRSRLPLNLQGQAVVLWGGWLLTTGIFFSVSRFFHLYYLVMLGPAIAALAGMGVPVLWRIYRQPSMPGHRLAGWTGWLLPVALLATAALQVHLLSDYGAWSAWLTPLIVGGTLLAAVVLAVGRLGLGVQVAPGQVVRVTSAVALVAVGVGLLAVGVAPTTWAAVSVADGDGSAWLPQAGPSGSFQGPGGGGGGRGFRGNGNGGGQRPFSFNGGQSPNSSGTAGQSGSTGPVGGSSSTGSAGGSTSGRTGQQGGFGSPPSGQTGQQGGFGSFPGGGFGGVGGGGAGGFGGGFGGGGGQRGFGGGFGGGGGGFGGGSSAGGAMTFAGNQPGTLDANLLRYLEANQGKTKYLVATTTSSYASLFILDTNQPAMALGGYQGWDRIVTPSGLAQLVANGTVRFFYIPASAARLPFAGQAGPAQGTGQAATNLDDTNDDLVSWVQKSCTAVPSTDWQTSSSTSSANSFRAGRGPGGGNLQLYDCAPAGP